MLNLHQRAFTKIRLGCEWVRRIHGCVRSLIFRKERPNRFSKVRRLHRYMREVGE
jgi:hypothetical protein